MGPLNRMNRGACLHGSEGFPPAFVRLIGIWRALTRYCLLQWTATGILLFAVVQLASCTPVSAGLVSTTVDGRSAHIDTATGVTWLDFSNSYNLSPNAVNADILPGHIFAGFHFATVAQLDTLYFDQGFGDIKATASSSTRSATEVANAASLFSTLGEPDSYDPTISPLIDIVHDVTNPASSTSPIDLITLTNTTVNSNPTKVTLGPTAHNSSTAFALVETPIPEPASLMLWVSGTLSLLMGHRRWWRKAVRGTKCYAGRDRSDAGRARERHT
jgi:hypothetical protein